MMDNYVANAMITTKKNCAHCNLEMKSALPFSTDKDVVIEPGDIIICENCMEMNTVDESANFIKPTQEYLDTVPPQIMFEMHNLITILKEKRKQANN
jgi:hypothetical protein